MWGSDRHREQNEDARWLTGYVASEGVLMYNNDLCTFAELYLAVHDPWHPGSPDFVPSSQILTILVKLG